MKDILFSILKEAKTYNFEIFNGDYSVDIVYRLYRWALQTHQ